MKTAHEINQSLKCFDKESLIWQLLNCQYIITKLYSLSYQLIDQNTVLTTAEILFNMSTMIYMTTKCSLLLFVFLKWSINL